MERKIGTVSRGVRCPIIREGDDLAAIVSQSVLSAAEAEAFELRDRDVIAGNGVHRLPEHREIMRQWMQLPLMLRKSWEEKPLVLCSRS